MGGLSDLAKEVVVLGVSEALVIVVVALLTVLPASRICAKAGYPAWLGVAAIVPGLNFVLAFYLAFSTWPIEKRVTQVQASPGA